MTKKTLNPQPNELFDVYVALWLRLSPALTLILVLSAVLQVYLSVFYQCKQGWRGSDSSFCLVSLKVAESLIGVPVVLRPMLLKERETCGVCIAHLVIRTQTFVQMCVICLVVASLGSVLAVLQTSAPGATQRSSVPFWEYTLFKLIVLLN